MFLFVCVLLHVCESAKIVSTMVRNSGLIKSGQDKLLQVNKK
jgi:hypothetical protein